MVFDAKEYLHSKKALCCLGLPGSFFYLNYRSFCSEIFRKGLGSINRKE